MVLFNRALLAKQGWRLLKRPDSLVARLLRAKYYPHRNFMEAEDRSDSSYVWKSILRGREVLEQGTRFLVGDGRQILVWEDRWLPQPFSFRPFSVPMCGTEQMRVCDFIDPENNVWLTDMLYELFSKEEAELIAGIPLSRRPIEDTLIWHFDRRGEYRVKSGYHLLRSVENMRCQPTASGSNGNVQGRYWNKIWHANIPPKVRTFVWKLCRNILPTRYELRKKVELPRLECILCRDKVETSLHLFKECPVIECFWFHGPLKWKSNELPGNDIWTWIMNVMDRFKGEQLDIFFMALWAAWCERNNLVFNGGVCNPFHMGVWAWQLLDDFKKAHPKCEKKQPRPPSRWVCPPTGRLKINVDGGFLAECGKGGIGVVARDDAGRCRAVLSRHIRNTSSALHTEAEAIRAGLQMALQLQWRYVEIESDNALVLTALGSGGADLVEVSVILADCKLYMQSFDFISLRHVYREANGVAHRLATLASRSIVDNFWVEEAPEIIHDVLIEDGCTTLRGLGSMSPSMYYPNVMNNEIG